MVSAKFALSGAVAASAVFAQSTVVKASTEVDVTATEVATVTHCTGSDVVSCHHVTSTPAPTSEAPATTEAPCTTEAPATEAPANSTEVVYQTSTDVEAGTSIVTVTHCTGSDVVSCHYVTSTPVPTTAAPVTTAPAGNLSTPVVAPTSEPLTTYVTVSEGVTLTKTAPCEPAPTGPATNGTGNATVPGVPATSGPEQANGQSALQVGVAGVAIAAVGALLI